MPQLALYWYQAFSPAVLPTSIVPHPAPNRQPIWRPAPAAPARPQRLAWRTAHPPRASPSPCGRRRPEQAPRRPAPACWAPAGPSSSHSRWALHRQLRQVEGSCVSRRYLEFAAALGRYRASSSAAASRQLPLPRLQLGLPALQGPQAQLTAPAHRAHRMPATGTQNAGAAAGRCSPYLKAAPDWQLQRDGVAMGPQSPDSVFSLQRADSDRSRTLFHLVSQAGVARSASPAWLGPHTVQEAPALHGSPRAAAPVPAGWRLQPLPPADSAPHPRWLTGVCRAGAGDGTRAQPSTWVPRTRRCVCAVPPTCMRPPPARLPAGPRQRLPGSSPALVCPAAAPSTACVARHRRAARIPPPARLPADPMPSQCTSWRGEADPEIGLYDRPRAWQAWHARHREQRGARSAPALLTWQLLPVCKAAGTPCASTDPVPCCLADQYLASCAGDHGASMGVPGASAARRCLPVPNARVQVSCLGTTGAV